MDLGIAGRGCAVVSRSEDGLGAAVAELLRAEGASVVVLERADAGALAGAAESLGSLDVLVNADAGAGFEEMTGADWADAFEHGVLGPLAAMRAVAPAMAERGWGRIVNVCGSAAELALSRLFADRYAGSGVLVNAVRPGPSEAETAGTIVFLCSERASYVDGAAL